MPTRQLRAKPPLQSALLAAIQQSAQLAIQRNALLATAQSALLASISARKPSNSVFKKTEERMDQMNPSSPLFILFVPDNEVPISGFPAMLMLQSPGRVMAPGVESSIAGLTGKVKLYSAGPVVGPV